jgi:hypothetical protein
MNDERSESEQLSPANQVDGTAQCGPECNCRTAGLGTKSKIIICLFVVFAAVVVLTRGFMQKAEVGQVQTAFASMVPTLSPAALPATTQNATITETPPAMSSLWGEPLKTLAVLNEVAAQKNAVFVYLPEKGRGPDEKVKRQIKQAADTAQSGGMQISFYTLYEGSQDYAQITSQVPAPCVLAMVKGRGMSVVADDISEGKLLQALVAASRPSGCGPSGCGPSSAGCN